MENARVGLFEDNELARAMLMQWLDMNHHRVVLVGDSLKSSLDVIEMAEADSIDVALLDGDLGLNPEEGTEIVKSLRQKMGSVAIINVSGEYPVEGADVHIPKGSVEKIIEHIASLPDNPSHKINNTK